MMIDGGMVDDFRLFHFFLHFIYFGIQYYFILISGVRIVVRGKVASLCP